jgi:hypothetical protein
MSEARVRQPPFCRHSPPYARLGDAQGLPAGRASPAATGSGPEAVQDASDGEGVGHEATMLMRSPQLMPRGRLRQKGRQR